MEATKKQIRALEEGIELLMVAEPDMTTPVTNVDTTELEQALQQEKDLRVKAESSKEEMKRKFKEAFNQERALRVKAESEAAEMKRKLDEAMAAHQSDKVKWAASISESMKKDEFIEDLQATIEFLNGQLAKKQPAKEVNNKVNSQQQVSIENHEVPDMPAQNDIPSIEETEVPDMATPDTWVHPNPTHKMFVTFKKNCANCPFANTCDVKYQESSKFGKNCGMLDMKNAAVNARELHVKVGVDKNQYIFPTYTKDGVFIGDVHENRENKKLIAELRNHRNKTVVVNVTPFKVVKDSCFTRYEAEIVDAIEAQTESTPLPANVQEDKSSNVVSESDLVFEDMTVNETEIGEVVDMEELESSTFDIGEPIASLF